MYLRTRTENKASILSHYTIFYLSKAVTFKEIDVIMTFQKN